MADTVREPLTPPIARGDPNHVLREPVACSVVAAWGVLSRTVDVNRAGGLEPFDYTDLPQPDGTSRRWFRTRIKGVVAEGEEFVSRWEFPRRFEIRRSYVRGPFREVVHVGEVQPDDDGALVTSSFWFVPRGLLGKVFTWGFGREVLPGMRRHIVAECGKAGQQERVSGVDSSEFAALPDDAIALVEAHEPSVAAIEKVEQIVDRGRRLYETPALERLGRHVLTASSDELERIRPLELARSWGVDRSEVVDACLAATAVGLLRLRWDVVCPHCRGDKENLASLEDVRADAFCSSCNLGFDVDLDRVLEVVFEPHPDIRRVVRAAYCRAGPGTVPHVMYQARLEPSESFEPTVDLPPGRYRVRFTGSELVRWLRVDPDGTATDSSPAIEVTDDGLSGPDLVMPPHGLQPIELRNGSSRPVVATIEDSRWADDALLGAELIADQRFRDLFSGEMLASGISLAVQSVTILFTDLVGSTAMYGELGDARAFRLVWNHFEVLTDIVRASRGATVKTIGDAVMAAFVHPEDALKAAAALHDRLEEALASKGHEYPTALKVGLHEGPTIVVTLNGRLDYFGQTVNTAARVQSVSDGGEIVVSQHLASLCEGAAVLRDTGWHAEPFEAPLKGLEHPLAMWRFRPPA